MPLHLLKDKMQEVPDHPLAKEFNWERVPEGVQLDQWVRSHLPEGESAIGAAWRLTGPISYPERQALVSQVDSALSFKPTTTDIQDSAKRLHTHLYHTVYHPLTTNSEEVLNRIHDDLAESPAYHYRYYANPYGS